VRWSPWLRTAYCACHQSALCTASSLHETPLQYLGCLTIGCTALSAPADEVLASRQRAVDGKPTSMADLGYVNANVDDAWQSCDYTCSAHHGNPPKFPANKCGTGVNGTYHNASGWPLVNKTRYPDMKAMTAKAHSLGLRAGFYMNTCECRESNWATDQLHEHCENCSWRNQCDFPAILYSLPSSLS
jgi:hypothetical protein